MKKLNEELDQGDELTKFFGLLQRFNHGRPLNEKLTTKIHEFFTKRWQNDRSIGFQSEEDQAIFE